MVTFSKLGKKGNLGNQLFQIASTIGIAKANGHEFAFPAWAFQNFFTNRLPVTQTASENHFYEPQFHFEPVALGGGDYDLEGWFQSEKYFDIPLAKEFFQFDTKLLRKIKNTYSEAFSKKTILISIRRGDFVDHPDYFQLPISFYINSLVSNFPNWRESNLIILSDDIKYCKFHFSFLENAFFGDGLSGIEQLVLATLCDDFIISNSTFSWWCAWLGEKRNSVVIRPLQNFSDEKRTFDNDNDYFPERWRSFNHLDSKIDLGNATVKLSQKNRHVQQYMDQNFNFSGKNDGENNVRQHASVNIVIRDVVVPPLALYEAAYLTNNKLIAVKCYLKGNLIKVSRYYDMDDLAKQFDFGIFARIMGMDSKVKSRQLLFDCSVLNDSDISEDSNIRHEDVQTFYSYAGTIAGLFAYKYALTVKTGQWSRTLKKSIKKLLKIKRK